MISKIAIKQKNRLHYIDIAKGILILMVIYGHVGWFIGHDLGYRSPNFDDVSSFSNIWTVFYMPAFFVITGYCSSFNCSFKVFLIKNIKSLIVPAFTLLAIISSIRDGGIHLGIKFLLRGEGFWFLYALFTAKMIYYFLLRFIKKESYVFIVSAILMLIGFICFYNKLPEFWEYQHALLLLPCLSFGKLMKHKNCLTLKYFVISIIAYSLTLSFYLLTGEVYPRVTGGIIMSIGSIIPFFVMSISGSLAILYLCYIVKESSLIETLGRHSLVIYCIHQPLVLSLGKMMGGGIHWQGLDSCNLIVSYHNDFGNVYKLYNVSYS